jgi:putative phage-type endonuclease
VIEQGTPEWLMERCGKVTASRVADILATTKSGPSASRQNYLAQLVAERMTLTVEPMFTNDSMRWGTEHEPIARAAYEVSTGRTVDSCGFINHPLIDMAGASPDGLIDHDGLVEIKCPNTATHLDYMLSAVVPKKYIPQMAWQIICTQREWCDFVSFDPRLPTDLQLFVVRFNPSNEELTAIAEKVVEFIAEVDDMVCRLENIQANRKASK